MHTRPLFLLLALAHVACAAAAPKDGSQAGDLEGPVKIPGVGSRPSSDGGLGTRIDEPALTGDCSIYDERLYYLGIGAEEGSYAYLYRFDPVSLLSTPIGPLVDCPLVDRKGGTWPMAMTVDAEGEGWVLFAENSARKARLLTFDLTTGECDSTNTATLFGMDGGTLSVTMSPLHKVVQDDKNTMYLAGVFGNSKVPRLATIDLVDFQQYGVAPLGPFVPTTLAGTDEGQIMGLRGNRLGEIDLAKGLLKYVDSLDLPSDPKTVMGYWGGDLWLFQPDHTDSKPLSHVYQASAETGETTLESSVETWVVGAGTVTCVPPKSN